MNPSLLQSIHLFFVAISFLCVLSSLVFSGLYLFQRWQLKHKNFVGIGGRLPSLEALDRYTVRSMIFGFASLSVLLVTGILLAHLIWKGNWIRDQKIIVAMVTWAWFLAILAVRFRFGVRGEKYFYFVLAGFLFLTASGILAWMM